MPILPSVGTRLGAGWGAYLKDAPFPPAPGRTAGDVLGDQVRFRLVRSGATSIDDVRPNSAAARELWAHEGVRDVIAGVVELAVQASDGPTPLRGFTLARDEAGYIANRATHALRHDGPSRATLQRGIADAVRHTTDTAAIRKGSWLHLGPERSAGLLEVLEQVAAGRDPNRARLDEAQVDSLGRGVKTLLHELAHVGSPRPTDATSLDWLSEGTAKTLARWPGRVEAAGRTLGVPVPGGVGGWFDRARKPYQEEVDSVRALLRMSGIDPTKARDFDAADQLLSRTPEDELPAELARRIADRHELAPPRDSRARAVDRETLEQRIRTVIEEQVAPDGSHADPAPLRELARSLGLDA